MTRITTVLSAVGMAMGVGLVGQPADATPFKPSSLAVISVADVNKDNLKAAKEKLKLARQDVKLAKQELKAAKQQFKAAKLELKAARQRGANAVPIPGTLLLFGAGFAGLVAWQSRDRKRPRDDMAA
ncbi:hypothetical protein [Candidatus Nitrospira bockiana]